MDDTLYLLLGRDDAELHRQVREISPRIEIVSPRQLDEQPDLLARVEVVYNGLKRERIPEATALKWMQVSGAGVNGLITPELRERDLVVTNVSGIHAQPIAEHLFGMLLFCTRALGLAWDQQKTRQWKGVNFGQHLDLLAGKTLGILGVGEIGGQAARVGQAFDMKVIGLRRGGKPHPHVEQMFTPETRLEFFAQCDIVMNTLPLTDKTRAFMAWGEFDALPDGAIVLNIGRGPTIEVNALLDALESGRLKAALLDVTDPEPLPSDHPLWKMPNVFITPHYSGGHPTYNLRADAIFLDNLRLYLQGEPLHHVVDKAEGY